MNEIDLSKYPSGSKVRDLYRKATRLEDLCGKSGELLTMGRILFDQVSYVVYDRGVQVRLNLPSKSNGSISEGDLVFIEGDYRVNGSEPSIDVNRIELCSKCTHPFSELKDKHRYTGASLVFDQNRRKTLIKRSNILKTIRSFLDQKGFIEVETPILQYYPDSAPVKTFDTGDNPPNHRHHLRICPEEYLKRLNMGLDKVYEMGKCFRNEGNSPKHSSEFTMLEAYEAYTSYEDTMKLTEELFEHVALSVNGTTKINFNGTNTDLKTPWARISVREAGIKHYGVDIHSISDVQLGEVVEAEGKNRKDLVKLFIERKIEPLLRNPTFLTDFPISYITYGKRKDNDPLVVEGAEAFIAGGLEIASAGAVNNDPKTIRAHNMQNLINKYGSVGVNGNFDEDLLYEMEFGLPPISGVGIGIDRLVMILGGIEDIKETQAYPFRNGDK